MFIQMVVKKLVLRDAWTVHVSCAFLVKLAVYTIKPDGLTGSLALTEKVGENSEEQLYLD